MRGPVVRQATHGSFGRAWVPTHPVSSKITRKISVKPGACEPPNEPPMSTSRPRNGSHSVRICDLTHAHFGDHHGPPRRHARDRPQPARNRAIDAGKTHPRNRAATGTGTRASSSTRPSASRISSGPSRKSRKSSRAAGTTTRRFETSCSASEPAFWTTSCPRASPWPAACRHFPWRWKFVCRNDAREGGFHSSRRQVADHGGGPHVRMTGCLTRVMKATINKHEFGKSVERWSESNRRSPPRVRYRCRRASDAALG